jgi:predicted Zn-ribbon and HTH transcriptional regulator
VLTTRRQLFEILSREPRSVSRLALELGLAQSDVEEHLRHLIRSARAAAHRVVVLPARCRACGFTFADDRLTKPGRCPQCRGTRILEAQLRIE